MSGVFFGGLGIFDFIQSGIGAIKRALRDELSDVVKLEQFFNGSFADALEKASTRGRVVHIHGTAYTWDRLATVAADTDIVLHGCTLTAAAGIAGTHLLTFAGNGSISGTGIIDGANLTAPSTTWAGAGVPQGCGIYAAGASSGSRSGRVRLSGELLFRGFPSGAAFVKWLAYFEAKGVRLSGCQTATLQYKASGSYANVPTTNTLGNERITSAGIEAYECDVVRVLDCTVPAVSKGVSIAAVDALSKGNIFALGTVRHAQEHLTNCALAISKNNFYNGYADTGIGQKIVYCDEVVSGGHVYANTAFCSYLQDCGESTLGPDTVSGVTDAAYAVTNTSSAGGRAADNVTIKLGTLKAAGAAATVLYVATDAGAVAAGNGFDISVEGGRAKGFARPLNQPTVGLGSTLDINWFGTKFIGTVEPFDGRIRSGNIDCTWQGCSGSALVDLGSARNVAAQTIVAGREVSVRVRALACSAASLVRYGGAAAIDAAFDKVSVAISSAGGTPTYALSFTHGVVSTAGTIGHFDALKLIDVKLNCSDIAGSGGQAINFNASSRTFRMRLHASVLGAGSFTPMNLTLSNAGSVTGVYEKPIAGVLTGGALTAV